MKTNVSLGVVVSGKNFRDIYYVERTIDGPDGVIELVCLSDDHPNTDRIGIHTKAIPEIIEMLKESMNHD